MVALFARLKWTLTTGRLRVAPTRTRVVTVIGLAVGLLISGLTAALFIGLRGDPDAAVPVIAGFFTLQALAWMLAPIIAFGVDETVDPRRFALLPLTPTMLQRGLLTSSLIGYLPVFNAIALLGAAVGLSTTWAVLPVSLLCCAAQLVTCVVLSRAASTSMASLMTSRRGRDLGMAVGVAVIVVYAGGSILLNTGGTGGDGTGVLVTLRALLWGPPGSLAELPAALAGGDGLRLVIALGTAAVTLALGWWWWIAALQRSLVTVPSTTAGSSPAHAGDLGRAVADSFRGTVLLVAARDLRLSWRDPLRRMPWVVAVLLAIVWPFLVSGAGGLFAVLLGSLIIGSQAANHLGVEGSGLWLHLVAFADRMRARGEMAGHALATLLPGVVVLAVALAVQVIARGHVALVPAAAGVCLAGLFGALGGACWMSAALPYAMPQSRTSMFASGVAGQKARSGGAAFAVLGIGLGTTVPAFGVAAAALTVDPAWGWLGLLVGLACGATVLVVLMRAGARRYLDRGPEILAVVSAGDRA